MPYTLAINFIFFAVSLLVGALFGWWMAKRYCKCDDTALRAELATLKIANQEHQGRVQTLAGELQGVQAKAAADLSAKVAQLESSASSTMDAQAAEANGFKARIAELEAAAAASAAPVTAAADNAVATSALHARIAELEGSVASASAAAASHKARAAELESAAASSVSGDAAATSALQARIAELEGVVGSSRDLHAQESANFRSRIQELEAATSAATAGSSGTGGIGQFAATGAGGENSGIDPSYVAGLEARLAAFDAGEMREAAGILGKSIKRDDLSVVEGIGPKIKELLTAAGITTWKELSETPVASLRGILDAGGSSFAIADPGTWAEQAKLLADSSWAAFKKLNDELDGGKRS